jgi:hypothetical protein
MPGERVVFLHYHLYKNAGTSIDRVFEKVCGPTFYLEAQDPEESVSNEAVLNLLRERPDLSYISSHALKPPRPSVPGCHLIDIVFLRHPIDRFGSIYEFSRADATKSGPTALAARRFRLPEFAAWMANETPWNFFDPQTTLMGNGGDFFYPPNEWVFENAMRRAMQVRVLGTVELFSQSMRAANYYLRGVRPDIDLVPPAERVNAVISRPRTLGERVRLIREAMGPKGFERLEEALSFDFRLWMAAISEVSRRHEICSVWEGAALHRKSEGVKLAAAVSEGR